jgi:signal transduction histidine kinase
MDKLFTPFFTTKGIGQGTGLGLPTTYGIIKMHKGKINVSSNADKSKGPTGTTFTITLPQINFNDYDETK